MASIHHHPQPAAGANNKRLLDVRCRLGPNKPQRSHRNLDAHLAARSLDDPAAIVGGDSQINKGLPERLELGQRARRLAG